MTGTPDPRIDPNTVERCAEVARREIEKLFSDLAYDEDLTRRQRDLILDTTERAIRFLTDGRSIFDIAHLRTTPRATPTPSPAHDHPSQAQIADKLYRCNICGFVIDARYAAEKPSAEFDMRGRSKVRPTPSESRLDPDTVERCAEVLAERLATVPTYTNADLAFGVSKKEPFILVTIQTRDAIVAALRAPSSPPAREGEIEAAILRIAEEMHFELHMKMYRVGSEQLRTYYAGFNISELAKRSAAALHTHAPAATGWRPGDIRCDECDNGLEKAWTCCPFCAKGIPFTAPPAAREKE